MGPRFNGVEDDESRAAGSNLAGLQWGHALMAWKTPQWSSMEKRSSRASMGPRFNGVEDVQATGHSVAAAAASMGPRFNGVEDCGSS